MEKAILTCVVYPNTSSLVEDLEKIGDIVRLSVNFEDSQWFEKVTHEISRNEVFHELGVTQILQDILAIFNANPRLVGLHLLDFFIIQRSRQSVLLIENDTPNRLPGVSGFLDLNNLTSASLMA